LRAELFGLALVLISGSAHAQTVYKCADPSGKASFQRKPCVGDPAKQPFLPLKAGERRAVAKALFIHGGREEEKVRGLEKACLEGTFDACDPLEQAVTNVRLTAGPPRPVYKCAGPDGKASFQREPCAGGLATERRFAPLSAADRWAIVMNADLPESFVQRGETACMKGDFAECARLDVFRTKTRAEQIQEFIVELRRGCEKKDQVACQSIAANERMLADHLKQEQEVRAIVPSQAQRAINEKYWPKCAAGDQQACSTVNLHYGQLCRKLADIEACDCAKGDRAICARVAKRWGR
jgi:hypothetical protein